MTTTVLAGSTGLVGSFILDTLTSLPAIKQIYAYTRRDLPTSSPNVTSLTSSDPSTWPSSFPTTPVPQLFLSGLGTTRAAAGSLENQRKIDLDLNLALAKAAKAAGVDTYVLISSTGANASSRFPYIKMKGELEEAVMGLGFKHVVLVKPGMILGDRKETRVVEWVIRTFGRGLGSVSTALTDSWAAEARVIGRAAVRAGLDCVEGKREEGVWELGQSDIIRLGRTEWKET
ncbi:NAD dependent epimerase/dehydratase family protein-like protein [Eremomyces bilateralis CBS 781.70]|uniref:NAD dependent epimerase/dehydratase family protein-like protein n=1 Tax=Eremomyces bilateralis CBS 781.70 TaxID=1392243 RepID=A0A6G1GIC5_9PEZI|nr:NAD dependent epimerase/dehydratase family protein-like protein [Eremomyces bilateralis CBS 781.70]KAF1817639.1 NAD dependent epimerase/dehydratase family protein-like protein [Eremomyces bilateralis CBS 781.70]